MKNTFKVGDSVRRTENDRNRGGWNLGDKVLVIKNISYSEGLEFAETDDHAWDKQYFESVEDSFESKVVKAYKLVGTKVYWKPITTGSIKSFKVDHVRVMPNTVDPLRLYDTDGTYLNYDKVVTAPIEVTVKLNREYNAIVTKDIVKVGCQEFPISIIDDLVKARQELTIG